MNKREFESFLMRDLKNKSIEQIEDTLNKIQLLWIPELSDKLYDKFSKSHFHCESCERWPEIKDSEEVQQTIPGKDVPVLSEEGKVERDLVADVTFLVTYRICPYCKHPNYKDQEITSITNRHYKPE